MIDYGKIQDIFEILNRTFSEFYNLSENLAFDIVIVLFTGRVIIYNIFPRSTCFGIKLYKLCAMTGYTCDWKYTWGMIESVWHSS